jgi:hypothetical protein
LFASNVAQNGYTVVVEEAVDQVLKKSKFKTRSADGNSALSLRCVPVWSYGYGSIDTLDQLAQ